MRPLYCDKRIAALTKDFCVTYALQELSKAAIGLILFPRVRIAQSVESRMFGFIDDFNDILNNSESSEFILRYNFEEIIISEAKYVTDTFLSIFRLLEALEDELMTIFYPEWDANLFSTCTNTKNQNFIVSAFRNTRDALSSYYAISASLLSKEHPALYQNRKYGYLYHPTKEQIIGMAPTDLSLHDSQSRPTHGSLCRGENGKPCIPRGKLARAVSRAPNQPTPTVLAKNDGSKHGLPYLTMATHWNTF